jgi:hypothetical protein
MSGRENEPKRVVGQRIIAALHLISGWITIQVALKVKTNRDYFHQTEHLPMPHEHHDVSQRILQAAPYPGVVSMGIAPGHLCSACLYVPLNKSSKAGESACGRGQQRQ